MTMRLTPEQVNELVNLLLDCPAIQDRRIRTDVLAFLPDNVRTAIPQRDQDRADVVNIVRTCNNYPGALEELIAGVRCFDEGTFAMQAVDDFRQGVSRPAQHPPQPSDPNQSYLHIEETLCRTDFKQAIQTFQDIMEEFGDKGGAALFLLQNSYAMGARWLVRRLDGILKENFYPIYPIQIGFASGMDQSELGVLQGLAKYFSVQNKADIEQYMNDIITQICTSIVTRKVIFIELSAWNRLKPQDKMLSWFVQKFWARLVDTLYTTIAQNDLRNIHLIIVMVSETEMPIHVLTPHLCHAHAFASEKILALPLETWSLADIQGWLAKCSPKIMPGHEIDDAAQRIYAMSNGGIPQMVVDILLREFAHIQEQ